MRVVAVVVSIGLALGGCAATDPKFVQDTLARDLPTDYKAMILIRSRKEFLDPYSIRSAGIAEPRVFVNSTVVCVEANAKNRMGGYIGIQQTAFVFLTKELTSVGDHTIMCPDNLIYKPFPELEHIQ